jgi:hypothetical protein
MADMKAIAFVRFNGVQLKGDKAAHVASLKKLIEAQPAILNSGAPSIATPTASTPPVVTTTTAAAAFNAESSESESDSESSASESDEADADVMQHAHLFDSN